MFIRTNLTSARIATLSARAVAANTGVAPIVADASPVKAWTEDYARKVRGTGSVVQRQQWELAVVTGWDLYGLAYGSQWMPCYICGDVFHAWTMDAEHLDPGLGTVPGLVLPACHECNREKGQNQVPTATVTQMLARYAGTMVPTGPRRMSALYRAAWRRPRPEEKVTPGLDRMASWRHGTPRPAHLRPVREG